MDVNIYGLRRLTKPIHGFLHGGVDVVTLLKVHAEKVDLEVDEGSGVDDLHVELLRLDRPGQHDSIRNRGRRGHFVENVEDLRTTFT